MHYFKKNIGDYAKKTGRLSMLQHGSYTLLIDACYDREQFPTLEQALEWTWASSKEEIEAVEFVLKRFFKLEDGLYVQHRIQEEIDNYHQKSQVNKRIANERETNRKENSTNRSPVVNEAPPNHKPRTINQEPKEKKSAVAPPPFELPDWINRGHWDAWHSCPKRKKATDSQKQMAVNKLDAWRTEGVDHAAALENAAIGGWQGLFKPDDKRPSVGSQTESFAERDARAKREAWEAMSGRPWPEQDLPGANRGDVIDAEPSNIRRIT